MNNELILLICGDRDWNDVAMIREKIEAHLSKIHMVITGGAPGADLIARDYCQKYQIPYLTVPARWVEHHKAAGPIRNSKMLVILDTPDEVWCFHDDIENSKGTKDMKNKANKAGIPVVVFSHQIKDIK